MRVEFEKGEIEYLLSGDFVPARLRSRLAAALKGTREVQFTEDEADELRDLCGEQLQKEGFNNEYQPTEEGQILEQLIDKLLVD